MKHEEASRLFVLSLVKRPHESAADIAARFASIPTTFSPDYIHPRWRPLYDAIVRHLQTGKAITDLTAAKIVGIQPDALAGLMADVGEDTDVYAEMVRKAYLGSRLAETAKRAIATATEDPTTAAETLISAVTEMMAPVSRIISIGEYLDEWERGLWDWQETLRDSRYVPYPFASLTDLAGVIRPGMMCLLTGLTGGGKSTFLTQWALTAAMAGRSVLFVHLEDTPDIVTDRLIGMAQGFIRYYVLRNIQHPALDEETRAAFANDEFEASKIRSTILSRDARRLIGLAKRFLQKTTGDRLLTLYAGGYTPEQLISSIEATMYRRRVDLVIVDYLNKLSIPERILASQNAAIVLDRAAEALKCLAERWGSVMVIAQQINDEGRGYGSRAPLHKSQVALHLERDRNDPRQFTLEVKKANWGQHGSRMPLRLLPTYMMFWEYKQQ